ncbi:hypothetical protein [Methylorubrum sp. SB2]|uniref:hypothetical protein n=1 Tax=Methylorubrum subtropicum TaxID=3138812 RepID=UPI00313F026E
MPADKASSERTAAVRFGMNEGLIPRRRAPAAEAVEACRLFYVGLTRARGELRMLHSKVMGAAALTEFVRRQIGEQGSPLLAVHELEEIGAEERRVKGYSPLRPYVLQRSGFGVEPHHGDAIDHAEILDAQLADLRQPSARVRAHQRHPPLDRVALARCRGEDLGRLGVLEAALALAWLLLDADGDALGWVLRELSVVDTPAQPVPAPSGSHEWSLRIATTLQGYPSRPRACRL